MIIGLVALASCWFIYWKLNSNMAEINQRAAISQQTHAFLPVQVAYPATSSAKSGLTADGIFLPVKEMWVLSETQGRILEVFKAKGDFVRVGEALAKVDDELLNLELRTVQLNLDKLEKDRQRLSNLIDADAVAKNKIEEVELGIATAKAKIQGLQKQIANTTIRAPMDGTITFRVIEKGGVIGLGIQVCQITDISTLILTVRVPELDVKRVRKGQLATVIPDAFAQKQFSGKVRNIGIKADQAFTYDIEVEVRNTPQFDIRAGMHGRANFLESGSDNGLFIPATAIVGSTRDAAVFVATPDSVAIRRTITIEKEEKGMVRVTSGLAATDLVITSGSLTLVDGARVRIVESQ